MTRNKLYQYISFWNLYGLLIRRNKGNANATADSMQAILDHYSSTSVNPKHSNFLPQDEIHFDMMRGLIWQKACLSNATRFIQNIPTNRSSLCQCQDLIQSFGILF